MTEVQAAAVRQVEWTSFNRHGMAWSRGPLYRRFVIMRTTSGFTVADTRTGDLERTTTLALARAWAGIRVGEQVVRHG